MSTKSVNKKEINGVEHQSLEDNIKTYVTFNKGGKWDLIKAPERDANGKTKKCYVESGCSLHLQMYSNNGIFAPPYSQESATGIVLGVGNMGSNLKQTEFDKFNTYMSRDGGLNWQEVKKGPHIYEIGDHGGIIVMAPILTSTTQVFYSWNEGLSFRSLNVIDTPIEVTNIIIEPSSTSQFFVLYGTRTDAETEESKAIIITLDF